MASRTSSFRIDERLSARLDGTAKALGKNRNWVLLRALEDYLDRVSLEGLAEEARRQSSLVAAWEGADAALWKDIADTSGWR